MSKWAAYGIGVAAFVTGSLVVGGAMWVGKKVGIL